MENEHTAAYPIAEAIRLSEVILVATPPSIAGQPAGQFLDKSNSTMILSHNLSGPIRCKEGVTEL